MTESDDPGNPGAVANVTTTIVRRIMSGRDDAFADWIQSGLGLARMFPGFLGGGWLKESSTSDVCVIVLRFETRDALDKWMTSTLRGGWLRMGEHIAVDIPVEHASTVVDLFDRPRS
ncbi:antibiotic biosynthesis monooxygenase [Rhodococcus sp. NPDC058505]|uniref:antibiotic biosynthesis monooxygenase n=1 Tax=unclassified Rhodococcus (in: high G+C Gram-positive bacteria) TaxID=192944 RepID=UPI003669A9A2